MESNNQPKADSPSSNNAYNSSMNRPEQNLQAINDSIQNRNLMAQNDSKQKALSPSPSRNQMLNQDQAAQEENKSQKDYKSKNSNYTFNENQQSPMKSDNQRYAQHVELNEQLRAKVQSPTPQNAAHKSLRNQNQAQANSQKQISMAKKVSLLDRSHSNKNINAVLPSSSVPNLQIASKIENTKSSKRQSRKTKQQVIISNYRDDLWYIHDQIAKRRQYLTDEANYSRQTNSRTNSNDGLKRFMSSCLCFSKCFNYVKRYQFNLKIETITCNKLSHCLFDFDCPDFSQYENEKYDHQVFKFHSLFSNQNEPKMLSLLDLSFARDQMKISYDANKLDKIKYQNQEAAAADGQITLPFPAQDESQQAKFLFKVVFKPESGQLWGFNEFSCDKDLMFEQDFQNFVKEPVDKQDSSPAVPKQGDIMDTSMVQGADQITANDMKMGTKSGNHAIPSQPSFISQTGLNNKSEFINSRQNLLDEQITINYDLSQPTINVDPKEDEYKARKKKRRLSKKERLAQENNFYDLPQAKLDKEIEFENDVDLAKTMWHVIRNKKSCNNILKRFETKDQYHNLMVNDIVKFGRVNFKVSIIKSDKLANEIQGGYHLLEKKNQEIQEQLEKLQHLKTQQNSYRDTKKEKMSAKQFEITLGRGELESDLRHARRENGDTTEQHNPLQTRENEEQLDQDAFVPTLNRHPTALYMNPTNQTNIVATSAMERTVDEVEALNQQYNSRNDQQRMDEFQGQTTEILGNKNIDQQPDVNFNNQVNELSKNNISIQKVNTGAKNKSNKFTGDLSSENNYSDSKSTSRKQAVDVEEAVCRICLCTEEDGTPSEDGQPDKLICPCKCAGSMGMIHISCLREWVNSKRLVYKGKKVQSFFWKALECELCQEAFENRMRYRMFQIMKFDLPNNDNEYMILESIKSAPAKVIHVFDLRDCNGKNAPTDEVFDYNNEFRVGRSVDTDMKIADISVSRVHSFIRCSNDRLIVQDNGSKFGTLVKISKPLSILSLQDNQQISHKNHFASIYQIGRTMFYFRFYDIQSHLVNNDTSISHVKSNLGVDANSVDMSYIPWKGTTFWRKTMLQHQLSYIPREFVGNQFMVEKDNMGRLQSQLEDELKDINSEEEDSSDEGSLNTHSRAMQTYKSNNATVRNSEQNFLASRIMIQDQRSNNLNDNSYMLDSQNGMSINAMDKKYRNTGIRINNTQSRPNTDMRRHQNDRTYGADDYQLSKDTSQVNLNQQAFSEKGRDLPMTGAAQQAFQNKKMMEIQQNQFNNDSREENKEMDFSSGNNARGNSPKQQNVVNILLRNNNDYVDQEHHGGDDQDFQNNENIQSFTSSQQEQSNGLQTGIEAKPGKRKRQMANEVKNMEIKHMKQMLNEDSGSEDMVDLNDRVHERGNSMNEQDAQQSFNFKEMEQKRKETSAVKSIVQQESIEYSNEKEQQNAQSNVSNSKDSKQASRDEQVIRQISEISGHAEEGQDMRRSSQTSIYNASGRQMEDLENFRDNSRIGDITAEVQLEQIREGDDGQSVTVVDERGRLPENQNQNSQQQQQ